MSTLYEQVKPLVIQGLWPAEIRQMLPNSADRTVQQYCTQIMKELTDTERAKIELVRKHRPRPGSGGRQFSHRKVVSQHHAMLGAKLYFFRKCLDMNIQSFCAHFKFSNRVQYSAMEQGYHDFTLVELLQIQSIMGFPITKVLEQIDADLSAERLLPDHPGSSPSA